MIYSYLGQRTLPSNIVKAIQPNYKTGPWIAGGCARCMWQNEAINDVDIWVANSNQILELTQRFSRHLGVGVSFSTDNALTFDYYTTAKGGYESKWKLQIIVRKRFSKLEEVFDDFDFTVCKIATNGEGRFYMTEEVADDLENRRLRVERFNKEGFLERWAKYTMYGFDMPKESLRAHLDDTELVWSLGDGRSLY